MRTFYGLLLLTILGLALFRGALNFPLIAEGVDSVCGTGEIEESLPYRASVPGEETTPRLSWLCGADGE